MFFLSRYENKIDSKGRVSVPAPYRAVLEGGGGHLIVTRSLNHHCLEGQGAERVSRIVEALDGMDSNSPESEALQSLLTNAVQVRPDNEGRILLAGDLLAYAEITDTVIFAGAGRLFRMWSPERWQKYEAAQAETLRKKGAPQLILNPGRHAAMPRPPDDGKEG